MPLSRRDFLKFSGLSAMGAAAGLDPIRLPGVDEAQAKKWFIKGMSVPELAAFDTTMIDYMQARNIRMGSLAVTRNGKLVLARGYSFVRYKSQAIRPDALFRIASISKPITAVAVLKLVQDGLLSLDDKVTDIITLTPMEGQTPDPRLNDVTILNLLQHQGGWDRDASFDPMFRDRIISDTFNKSLPITKNDIIKYMTGRMLDFTPGTKYAYSNYGYLLFEKIIKAVTGISYKRYVRQNVFAPLGITRMVPGRTLKSKRRPTEVTYRSQYKRYSVFQEDYKLVPGPYGGWKLENMLAHGGWLSSAVDLVRFASAFDDPANSPLLSESMINSMFGVPATGMNAGNWWYGCGWSVRQAGDGLNTWHFGSLDGTYTGLIRRHDGLNWSMLFNQRDDASGLSYGAIDSEMHVAANSVSVWPDIDQWGKYF